MIRRKRVLLTAVVTVTLPGLLAILAILGHEHAPAAAVTGAGTAETSRAPAASGAILGWVTARERAQGLRLLTKAADAGQSASYAGTELISEPGVDGTVKTVSQVQHRAGTTPDGVFGVTRSLVPLLGRHYVALYQGTGSAAERPAVIVSLYRFDGSLAARYWLDKRTMLPLTRELYDTADRVIGRDAFVRVKLGGPLSYARPLSAASSRVVKPAQAWTAQVPASSFRTSLVSQGWRVPASLPDASLPGGLPLYSAASTRSTAGEVADLGYSDGLYVVSLFVQRGTLTPDMPGWQPVRLDGRTAYVDGRSVAWTGAGFVYTMIADAPVATVTQTVADLSDNPPAGFLGRLGRGLGRLAKLVDPFG